MYPDSELKENVVHGTKKQPISGLHFENGPGTENPEKFFVANHWHSEAEIIEIRKGNYLVEINLEEYVLKKGDFCIFNSGDLHQLRGISDETEHDVILFDPGILDFAYADEWEVSCIAPFVNQTLGFRNILRAEDATPETAAFVQHLIEVAVQKPENWYVRCKILLLICLRLLADGGMLVPRKEEGADARKIGRYKKLVSYMEKHYAEPVTLGELADIIPCNSQYLCRFFKEIAGVTPIQYLISYRVTKACQQLAATQKPVVEIAMECGFDNISYFIRKFRELMGCTPGEYRRRENSSGS